MKIVHLSKSDLVGGAARAAYRLHIGLRRIGINSQMLVDKKMSDDLNIYEPEGKIRKAWSRVRPSINKVPLKFYDCQETPFYSAWIGRNVTKIDLLKKCDIIHLHWIAGGFLSINGISRLRKLNKPVVWTLHDMWAFTGGCHHSGDCEKYIYSCGSCPQLSSTKNNDITKILWKRKQRAYKNLNLTIVSPSQWLASCAKRSSLFQNSKIKIIPHGLNIDVFKPIEKFVARNILNLPKNKNIILFGAFGKFGNRKGLNYLRESISRIKMIENFNKEKLYLVNFGSPNSPEFNNISFEIKFFGKIHDDYSLTLLYSAADVFVAPSLQEAFGQTLIEAMSCGTPCVAFNKSGPKDIVDHKINGYLAEYKNAESLTEGIKWILEDERRAKKLAEAARKKTVEKYSLKKQARKYLNLYNSLLD